MNNQMMIQLQHFEGPLALLLYLIRKDEMDIMDIKIHEITGQYLDYIKLMKELDIEVAGEFIAMAATLIHIKSRILLPQYGENGEVVEQEDPRKELVQKLLEYQKYQEAAKLLYERPLVGRDVWLRGVREKLQPKEEEIEIEESGLFSLITSYRKILRAAHKRIHRVAAKTQSIASRILQIKDRLIVGAKIALHELVTETEEQARQTLITFLSLLELAKLGFVRLAQNEPYSELWVLPQRPIETDALARVEEYDNIHSQDVVTKLTEEIEVPVEGEQFSLLGTEDGEQTVFEGQMDGDALLKDIENLKFELAEETLTDDMASDDEIMAAEDQLTPEKDPEYEQ